MTRLCKAIIPVAGLGTRMLPFTKEQPKEMLPIYTNGNGIAIKPMIQFIFEELYNSGFREFCFIVGRGKRVIEDHFTINHSLHNLVDEETSKNNGIEEFYHKVQNSSITWINQEVPRGFGHAVLLSAPLTRKEEFLVHAGDVSIISLYKDKIVDRMRTFHHENNLDVTLVVKKINDMESLRQHGIVVTGEKYKDGFAVTQVVEKPRVPPSNLAIMPIYIFKPVIHKALKKTSPDRGGELQLTDAIQRVIKNGGKVGVVEMKESEVRLDIGTPQSYMEALSLSYKFSESVQIPLSRLR